MDRPYEEPAFPTSLGEIKGMSLRDWFAGQALAGLIASTGTIEGTSRLAYAYADAMLAERAKGSK